MIIADKLDQSMMEEFADKDLKNALIAKKQLIDAIEKSMKPGGFAYDKEGKPISVYDSALNAFQKSSKQSAKSDNQNTLLQLSLGSLENGLPTTAPIPKPDFSSPVDISMSDGKVYKSFVNVPYKNRGFVFGGIGAAVSLVDQRNWRAKLDNLPYQIPTIVKVAQVEKRENEATVKVLAVACAQPASHVVPRPEPGALTISFPDGPVPEIKHPADCYLNEKLNSRDADTMDLLSANGGDYPSDSNSRMENMNWPLTGSTTAVSTADVWRQALYDWIRRAGPTANIDSIVNMQKILLDAPRPQKILWKAPLSARASHSTIAPIPAGTVHIFEFDQDGIVVYRSKIQAPYPLDVASHHQMYGENYGALDHSAIGTQDVAVITSPVPKKIILLAAWDVFI
ncbi:MAG: hypothetical protein SGJ27_21340 [Candidatus Melainabacteria bacterium]|nr:hypothetical protein [Candidatus Melainabacteria bacterium]